MRPTFALLLVLGPFAALGGCSDDLGRNTAQGAGVGAVTGIVAAGAPGAVAGAAIGAAFGAIVTPGFDG